MGKTASRNAFNAKKLQERHAVHQRGNEGKPTHLHNRRRAKAVQHVHHLPILQPLRRSTWRHHGRYRDSEQPEASDGALPLPYCRIYLRPVQQGQDNMVHGCTQCSSLEFLHLCTRLAMGRHRELPSRIDDLLLPCIKCPDGFLDTRGQTCFRLQSLDGYPKGSRYLFPPCRWLPHRTLGGRTRDEVPLYTHRCSGVRDRIYEQEVPHRA